MPHIVEQFDHLLVDDEDDGHVQAHAAQPGNGSLVEAVGTSRSGKVSLGKNLLKGLQGPADEVKHTSFY